MKAPFLVIVGTLVLAPPVTGVFVRRRLSGARAWVFWWGVSQAVESLLQYGLALRGTPNLWVGYVFEPVSGALLLWALSLWHGAPGTRRALRLAIPVVLAAYLWLTIAFDGTSLFSRAAQPALYLVCLGASAWTLVERSRTAEGDPLRSDWLWICVGLALFYATGSTLLPLARLLFASDRHLFDLAYEIANLVAGLAFLSVARGLACPTVT